VHNDLQAEFDTAPAAEGVKAKCSTAAFPKLFMVIEVESRCLLLQCHVPPPELLLHLLVYHWLQRTCLRRTRVFFDGLVDWWAACKNDAIVAAAGCLSICKSEGQDFKRD
jgi:hypothetical protein